MTRTRATQSLTLENSILPLGITPTSAKVAYYIRDLTIEGQEAADFVRLHQRGTYGLTYEETAERIICDFVNQNLRKMGWSIYSDHSTEEQRGFTPIKEYTRSEVERSRDMLIISGVPAFILDEMVREKRAQSIPHAAQLVLVTQLQTERREGTLKESSKRGPRRVRISIDH